MAYSTNISFESTYLSPALVFPCDSFDKLDAILELYKLLQNGGGLVLFQL